MRQHGSVRGVCREAYLYSTIIIEETEKLAAAWDDLRQQSAAGVISDRDFALSVLNEFMPKCRDLAEKAEKLSLNLSPEIREAHEELIKGLNLNLQAFSEVVAAVDSSDYSRITSANKFLSDARAAERIYMQKLETLADKYGVKLR